jgi:hypothetical protein
MAEIICNAEFRSTESKFIVLSCSLRTGPHYPPTPMTLAIVSILVRNNETVEARQPTMGRDVVYNDSSLW